MLRCYSVLIQVSGITSDDVRLNSLECLNGTPGISVRFVRPARGRSAKAITGIHSEPRGLSIIIWINDTAIQSYIQLVKIHQLQQA